MVAFRLVGEASGEKHGEENGWGRGREGLGMLRLSTCSV